MDRNQAGRTTHINVQYFSITDRLKAGALAELSTSQQDKWKVIILQRHFKGRHFTLIAKLS